MCDFPCFKAVLGDIMHWWHQIAMRSHAHIYRLGHHFTTKDTKGTRDAPCWLGPVGFQQAFCISILTFDLSLHVDRELSTPDTTILSGATVSLQCLWGMGRSSSDQGHALQPQQLQLRMLQLLLHQRCLHSVNAFRSLSNWCAEFLKKQQQQQQQTLNCDIRENISYVIPGL